MTGLGLTQPSFNHHDFAGEALLLMVDLPSKTPRMLMVNDPRFGKTNGLFTAGSLHHGPVQNPTNLGGKPGGFATPMAWVVAKRSGSGGSKRHLVCSHGAGRMGSDPVVGSYG